MVKKSKGLKSKNHQRYCRRNGFIIWILKRVTADCSLFLGLPQEVCLGSPEAEEESSDAVQREIYKEKEEKSHLPGEDSWSFLVFHIGLLPPR